MATPPPWHTTINYVNDFLIIMHFSNISFACQTELRLMPLHTCGKPEIVNQSRGHKLILQDLMQEIWREMVAKIPSN